MAGFGVSSDGFNIKGIDVILAQAMDRARQVFDPNVDLSSTSPLRKILEVTAAEDVELWKGMEDLYYGSFLSTAVGESLDRLGEDLGIARRQLFASGEVQFTLANPAVGRSYVIPAGAVVVTSAPVQAFFTNASVTLSSAVTQGVVGATAFARGTVANVPAALIKAVEPGFLQANLSLGAATLSVTNSSAFSVGEQFEMDDDYRVRLLGFPRNMWTVQSVQAAAAAADGVIDVLVSDPLGGVDVSQSFFNLFNFSQRLFSSERQIGQPYFFSVVVAHQPEWPWHTQEPITGIFEQVFARVDAVRPVGIFANIVEADRIEVGL